MVVVEVIAVFQVVLLFDGPRTQISLFRPRTLLSLFSAYHFYTDYSLRILFMITYT